MSSLLLIALGAAASPPVEPGAARPAAEKKICRYEDRIGTLAGRRRVCHTAAEWDQIAASARDTYRQVQGAHGSTASMEPDIIRAQPGQPPR